jgi:SAM-dependent methyltransferase
MTEKRDDGTLAFWNRVAHDWEVQVGEHGDVNRRANSDPVLWRFAGDVRGLDVLDAGCGTGYLSRRLAERGARVVGVDFSPAMVEIAAASSAEVDFRVDDCSQLATVGDGSIDLVVSNYVLMDTPHLDGSMHAFGRVLRRGGAAVVIFSHPCFPQGSLRVSGERNEYHWHHSYFDARRRVDPPWAHFTSEFIWFHRPLSHYWRSFRRAGFEIVDFDEPHIEANKQELADSELLAKLKMRPMSVAFSLRKTS